MKLVKIADKQNNILRFDTDARFEVFISQWDLEDHPRYKEIIQQQNVSDEIKISQLKDIASELAFNKKLALDEQIRENKLGIEITADNLGASTIDFERMPWYEMLHPELDELE